MRPFSLLPSISAQIHDCRRASIVSAMVPGALGGVAGAAAADAAAGVVLPPVEGAAAAAGFPAAGAGVAAESGAESRPSAHHNVPTTASAPVAAKRPTNVRADRAEV